MTREDALHIAKPILFNTKMVQAIIEGRKTVTRRVVKRKYGNTHLKMRTDKYSTSLVEVQNDIEGETYWKNPDGSTTHSLLAYLECNPRYKAGDILYVREMWMANNFGTHYRADWPNDDCPEMYFDDKWRPSIHMPKEAARIFLRVLSVRAEQLQDITEEQTLREGVCDYTSTANGFADLWDSTIKKSDWEQYSWRANPWVWVFKFERVSIDEN